MPAAAVSGQPLSSTPRMSHSILYIHGFNSSPASAKARQLSRLMDAIGLADALRVPALGNHPQLALQQLDEALAELGRPLLVGSSLGGYYATVLAERHGLRALLINPAVRPWTLFEGRLGEQYNYHSGERWELGEEHLAALEQMQVPAPGAGARYQVWLQTADETLDYRQAEGFYRNCALRIQAGGDHGFQGFAERLPALLLFAGVDPRHWQEFDFSTLTDRHENP